MSATSKILQLVEIIRAKDSSSISAVTWFISAFTNLSKSESSLELTVANQASSLSSANLHNFHRQRWRYVVDELYRFNRTVLGSSRRSIILQETKDRITFRPSQSILFVIIEYFSYLLSNSTWYLEEAGTSILTLNIEIFKTTKDITNIDTQIICYERHYKWSFLSRYSLMSCW